MKYHIVIFGCFVVALNISLKDHYYLLCSPACSLHQDSVEQKKNTASFIKGIKSFD
jgi:hypothetical protein